MTWQGIVIIIGILGIIISAVLLTIILYILFSGSYKRYAEMRAEHIAQMQRIEESVQRRRREAA